jgi:hypothetical protein
VAAIDNCAAREILSMVGAAACAGAAAKNATSDAQIKATKLERVRVMGTWSLLADQAATAAPQHPQAVTLAPPSICDVRLLQPRRESRGLGLLKGL